MKQSDLFAAGEGDEWHRRNKDKPRLPDPVIEAMQACQLQPKNVLEIGCGDGWRLEEIRNIWKCSVRGYDPSIMATNERAYCLNGDALFALKYMGDARYDTIIFGFCLYLVDREDLMMITAHTDRVLQDKGHIIIHDFFPPLHPYQCKYKHKEGVWSYHQDYSNLWLCNPAYRDIYGPNTGSVDDAAVVILQKDIAAGWPERAE